MTVLVIIAAVLIATRWDVGGGTDTTQRAPALEHPGNVDPWQAYFAGLTSERGAPDTASACRAGAGLDCLLAQVR